VRSHPLERSVNADPRIVSPEHHQQPPDPGINATDAASPDSKHVRRARGVHVWLFRLRALLFVTLCATFGVLLTIVPWTPKWTDNPLLLNFPDLRNTVASGFFRGAASGLGILNLWVGFWEAIHYHEPSG
jgi:hypothetical protein